MSRKHIGGSGKPSGRRKSGPPDGAGAAGPDTGGARRPWSFAAGIVFATLALFGATATLRAIFIDAHRGDYVRDELVVETLDSDGGLMFGQIASTEEDVQVDPRVLGLDRARQMQREGRLKGHRFPIWYLPNAASRTWWGVGLYHVQVLPEDGFGAWPTAVAINVALALCSLVLIRCGLKKNSPTANAMGPGRTSRSG